MAEQSPPLDQDAEWETANEIVVATEHLGFVREHLAPISEGRTQRLAGPVETAAFHLRRGGGAG